MPAHFSTSLDIKEVSPCQAYSSGRISVQKELCFDTKGNGLYLHNMTTKDSNPKIKSYFLHPDTDRKVYTDGTCKPDSETFQHKKDQCQTEFLDNQLINNFLKKEYFVDDVYQNKKIYVAGSANECVDDYKSAYVNTSSVIDPVGSVVSGASITKSGSSYSYQGIPIDLSGGASTPEYKIVSSNSGTITRSTSYSGSWGPWSTYTCQNGYVRSQGAVETSKTYVENEASDIINHETIKITCSLYDYREDLQKFQTFHKYIRSDGSFYEPDVAKIFWRVIK